MVAADADENAEKRRKVPPLAEASSGAIDVKIAKARAARTMPRLPNGNFRDARGTFIMMFPSLQE